MGKQLENTRFKGTRTLRRDVPQRKRVTRTDSRKAQPGMMMIRLPDGMNRSTIEKTRDRRNEQANQRGNLTTFGRLNKAKQGAKSTSQ